MLHGDIRSIDKNNVAVNEIQGTPFVAVSVLMQMPYEPQPAKPSSASTAATVPAPAATTGTTPALPDLGAIWMGHLVLVKQGTAIPAELVDPAEETPSGSTGSEAPPRGRSTGTIAGTLRHLSNQLRSRVDRPPPVQPVHVDMEHVELAPILRAATSTVSFERHDPAVASDSPPASAS